MSRYNLDKHNNKVLVADLLEWARWFATANLHVGDDTPVPGVRVATVFLGIDHGRSSGAPPILFETKITGGENDGIGSCYFTWREAPEGHCSWVARVCAANRDRFDRVLEIES